jgi:hypothetical protein
MVTKGAPFALFSPWFDCFFVPTCQISHVKAQCQEKPRAPTPHPPGPDQVMYFHVSLQNILPSTAGVQGKINLFSKPYEGVKL